MKTKIIKLITLALTAISLVGLTSVAPVYAANDICSNDHVSDEIKIASGCSKEDLIDSSTNVNNLEDTIIGILNGVIGLLSVVAIIVIIIGGVRYMTSSGDSAKLTKARDTILYAAIGLIICALAAVIVNFVVNNLIKGEGRETTTSQESSSNNQDNSSNTNNNSGSSSNNNSNNGTDYDSAYYQWLREQDRRCQEEEGREMYDASNGRCTNL